MSSLNITSTRGRGFSVFTFRSLYGETWWWLVMGSSTIQVVPNRWLVLYKYFGRKRQYFQAESNPLRVHREIKEKPQSGMKY